MHLAGPLLMSFTLWMEMPHSPWSKPAPKYLKFELSESNLSDSRTAFSPGISNLKQHIQNKKREKKKKKPNNR